MFVFDVVGCLSSGSGYTEQGNLYKCPACGKGFYNLSGMMAHQQSRPQCRDGQNVNLRLGHSGGQQQQMRFYHGSAWSNAWSILQNGFIPSESGCLGRGVYVAREDKARRFAEKRAREAEQRIRRAEKRARPSEQQAQNHSEEEEGARCRRMYLDVWDAAGLRLRL